jgi:hypothetical protein
MRSNSQSSNGRSRSQIVRPTRLSSSPSSVSFNIKDDINESGGDAKTPESSDDEEEHTPLAERLRKVTPATTTAIATPKAKPRRRRNRRPSAAPASGATRRPRRRRYQRSSKRLSASSASSSPSSSRSNSTSPSSTTKGDIKGNPQTRRLVHQLSSALRRSNVNYNHQAMNTNTSTWTMTSSGWPIGYGSVSYVGDMKLDECPHLLSPEPIDMTQWALAQQNFIVSPNKTLAVHTNSDEHHNIDDFDAEVASLASTRSGSLSITSPRPCVPLSISTNEHASSSASSVFDILTGHHYPLATAGSTTTNSVPPSPPPGSSNSLRGLVPHVSLPVAPLMFAVPSSPVPMTPVSSSTSSSHRLRMTPGGEPASIHSPPLHNRLLNAARVIVTKVNDVNVEAVTTDYDEYQRHYHNAFAAGQCTLQNCSWCNGSGSGRMASILPSRPLTPGPPRPRILSNSNDLPWFTGGVQQHRNKWPIHTPVLQRPSSNGSTSISIVSSTKPQSLSLSASSPFMPSSSPVAGSPLTSLSFCAPMSASPSPSTPSQSSPSPPPAAMLFAPSTSAPLSSLHTSKASDDIPTSATSFPHVTSTCNVATSVVIPTPASSSSSLASLSAIPSLASLASHTVTLPPSISLTSSSSISLSHRSNSTNIQTVIPFTSRKRSSSVLSNSESSTTAVVSPTSPSPSPLSFTSSPPSNGRSLIDDLLVSPPSSSPLTSLLMESNGSDDTDGISPPPKLFGGSTSLSSLSPSLLTRPKAVPIGCSSTTNNGISLAVAQILARNTINIATTQIVANQNKRTKLSTNAIPITPTTPIL